MINMMSYLFRMAIYTMAMQQITRGYQIFAAINSHYGISTDFPFFTHDNSIKQILIYHDLDHWGIMWLNPRVTQTECRRNQKGIPWFTYERCSFSSVCFQFSHSLHMINTIKQMAEIYHDLPIEKWWVFPWFSPWFSSHPFRLPGHRPGGSHRRWASWQSSLDPTRPPLLAALPQLAAGCRRMGKQRIFIIPMFMMIHIFISI